MVTITIIRLWELSEVPEAVESTYYRTPKPENIISYKSPAEMVNMLSAFLNDAEFAEYSQSDGSLFQYSFVLGERIENAVLTFDTIPGGIKAITIESAYPKYPTLDDSGSNIKESLYKMRIKRFNEYTEEMNGLLSILTRESELDVSYGILSEIKLTLVNALKTGKTIKLEEDSVSIAVFVDKDALKVTIVIEPSKSNSGFDN